MKTIKIAFILFMSFYFCSTTTADSSDQDMFKNHHTSRLTMTLGELNKHARYKSIQFDFKFDAIQGKNWQENNQGDVLPTYKVKKEYGIIKGNDNASGYVGFEIDIETPENSYLVYGVEANVDHMYESFNYSGWLDDANCISSFSKRNDATVRMEDCRVKTDQIHFGYRTSISVEIYSFGASFLDITVSSEKEGLNGSIHDLA